MKFKIEVPNKSFKGSRMGVVFADGVGITENQAIAEELARKGYNVETVDEAAAGPVDPWEEITVKLIDAYAKECGITWADGVKNKGHKTAALEDLGITPEMLARGASMTISNTDKQPEGGSVLSKVFKKKKK